MSEPLLQVADALRQARRVLTVTHINPDGDALGSNAALAEIAVRLGADVRMILPAALPDFLSWLPLPAPVVPHLAALEEWQPDLVVFTDCGDAGRAGGQFTPFVEWSLADPSAPATVNIDHHLSNPGYARINWVESRCSSTGELIGRLAEHLGFPLSGTLGQAIFLALSSDTGSFSYANTTASCFTMAARIMENGFDLARFTEQYENTWSISRMHLWGRLMSEVQLHYDGAVAAIAIPRAYLTAFGLGKADLEGFASQLRRVKGVRVSLLVREDDEEFCKISLRSMGDVDVRAIASAFEGGGHAAAAGAELEMPLAEVMPTVIAEIGKHLGS